MVLYNMLFYMIDYNDIVKYDTLKYDTMKVIQILFYHVKS